jgi:hypothetical protein
MNGYVIGLAVGLSIGLATGIAIGTTRNNPHTILIAGGLRRCFDQST